MTALIKIRTYSKSGDELWWDEWQSPLRRDIPAIDSPEFYTTLVKPPGPSEEYGFVTESELDSDNVFLKACLCGQDDNGIFGVGPVH